MGHSPTFGTWHSALVKVYRSASAPGLPALVRLGERLARSRGAGTRQQGDWVLRPS
ncbi:Uncharacterised protein [Mycobacterium tuberculosis]|nr:Uncharacterised protein [Mycobacterium tuberculosis]